LKLIALNRLEPPALLLAFGLERIDAVAAPARGRPAL